MLTWIIIGVVVVVLLFVIVGAYNRLVALDQAANQSFADIDVQLKQRQDLIPNLVETVKGYAAHEKGTLDAVIQARSAATAASSVNDKVQAENMLTASLGRLFALSEAYPDLKANQNMMQLTEELTSTENKIAFARQAYNDSVMVYNTTRETFPNVIFAGMFGFLPAELFKIDDPTERNAPKVSFTS